ncbi:RluA family pseudouridine synthase [Lactobacillaceae bacterium Scapto_B20]
MIVLKRKTNGGAPIKLEWQYQNQTGNTLKSFLKQRGISHRMFLGLRKDGEFKVNGHATTNNVALKPGDVINVTLPDEASDPTVLISHQPLIIIYEDANWLIIDKPAGLTSVPGPSNREDTLVNRIKGHLVDSGSRDLRPHLITRLDRFTSGVVLVAKHRIANSFANQQVMNHAIDKRYIAFVSGQINEQHAIIDFPIGKQENEIRRHRMATGQSAKTEYQVLKQFKNFTMVNVKLHTGRTHQIRVHFTENGHPLLGDQLYDGPLNLGIERQALHASELTFYDPFKAQFVTYQAPLPNDMQKLVEQGGE